MYNNYTSTNEEELSMNSSIAHLSSIAHILGDMQSKLPENLKALRKSVAGPNKRWPIVWD